MPVRSSDSMDLGRYEREAKEEEVMTQQQYADVFKALSHASRLQLLELLAQQGELSVSELTELMPRESSTISRHLSLLNLQGLVTVRQEAQNRYYALNPQRIQRVFEGFLREQLAPKPVTRL